MNVAALDIGTNSILLLLAKEKNGEFYTLKEFSRTTRLGEETGKTGKLKKEAMERTLDTIEEFLCRAEETVNKGTGLGAGTSACRDASNSDEFLNLFQQRFGWKPAIFSGEEEATATFLGAVSDQPDDMLTITVDIGGGSTEIGFGTKTNCLFAESLNLGCVRFGEHFNLYEESTKKQRNKAAHKAAELLAPIVKKIQSLNPENARTQLIASGGTATTFGAADLEVDSTNRMAMHGHLASRIRVEHMLSDLSAMNSETRGKQKGISPGRAPVLPAGLVILKETLKLLEIETFHITTRGIRYGMLVQLSKKLRNPSWEW